MPSNKSDTQASTQSTIVSPAEWPSLPTVPDSQSIYAGVGEQWLEQECPVELEQLPFPVPGIVARFIRESTLNEVYLCRERSDCVPGSLQVTAASPVAGSGESSTSGKNRGGADETVRTSSNDGDGDADKVGKNSIAKTGVKKGWNPFEPKKQDCAGCFDNTPVKRLTTLPCGHRYCNACLGRITRAAMESEDQHPPRCCSWDIPTETILTVLSSKEKKRYTFKAEEYATPLAERSYCPRPNCGKWIPPKHLTAQPGKQKCPHCKTKVASDELANESTNANGAYEPDLAAFLKEARRHGWQRCHTCGAMVELVSGCRRVKCRCAAMFCYECGNKWGSKACTCQSETKPPELDEAGRHGIEPTIENARRPETREEQRRHAIEDQIAALRNYLAEANKYQHTRLVSRQNDEGVALLNRQKKEVARFHSERADLTAKQGRNHGIRVLKLAAAHDSDIKNLAAEHEEEENALVARMARLFRGQANADEREVAVLAKLRGDQEGERLKLVEAHERALRDVEDKAADERAALESSIKSHWETEQGREKGALRELVQRFIYERYWFEQAVGKRGDMLVQYRRGLIETGGKAVDLVLVGPGGHDSDEPGGHSQSS